MAPALSARDLTAPGRKRARAIGALALAAAALIVPQVLSSYMAYVVEATMLYATAACGLNVLAGNAGLLSFGHGALWGIGAYTYAILQSRYSVSPWLGLAAAPAVAALFGAVLGLVTRRLQGFFLALATLALAIVLPELLAELEPLTGGYIGLSGLQSPALPGLEGDRALRLLIAAALVAVFGMVRNLHRLGYVRRLELARAAPAAAEACGLDVSALRLATFTLSAAIAGLAGALYAPLVGYLSPDSVPLGLSLQLFLIVLIGGLGWTYGPVPGALIVYTLPQLFLRGFENLFLLSFGILTLGISLFLPRGLKGMLDELWRWIPPVLRPAESGTASGAGPDPPDRATTRGMDGAPVSVAEVEKAFGAHAVLRRVTFACAPGSVTGVMGPNGSGKTTLLNIVSRLLDADAGVVRIGGVDLRHLPPHAVARAGVARTFQTPQLVVDLSVSENVAVGTLRGGGRGLLACAVGTPAARAEEGRRAAMVGRVLRECGIRDLAYRPVASLPHAERRFVELARALAADPDVLLLDEPGAGMGRGEVGRVAGLVEASKRRGISVLLVEHNLELMAAASDRVVVLFEGRVLTEGCYEEVRVDPRVKAAYLGDL